MILPHKATTLITLLVTLFILTSADAANLPKCDYSKSIRVGSSFFELCVWNKVDAPGVGLLQVAAVTNGRMDDIVTFDIFGQITDLGVSDIDKDDDPELHILVEPPDSGHYPELYFIELAKGELDEYTIPEMNELQASGYMGHDSYTFEDDRIVREFPLYEGAGSEARPTGGRRRITYTLSDSSLIFQSRVDISPEPVPDSAD